MVTTTISIYVRDENFQKYLDKKKIISAKVKALVKAELENEIPIRK